MNPFKLQIYTQEKKAFDAEVVSLMLPGEDGSLGIWANHAPIVAALGEGKLWFKQRDGNETTYRVSGGFLEVHGNVATVLIDDMKPAEGASA